MHVTTALSLFGPFLNCKRDNVGVWGTWILDLPDICANCIVHCDWLNTRQALIGSFTHSITCVSFDILAPTLFHMQ